MMGGNKNIWHCPKCIENGIILMKTESPFLGEGEIVCRICNNRFSFKEVMKYNIKNLKKHYNSLKNN